MTTISIEIAGVAGTAELDDAQEAAKRLLDALPLSGTLTHGYWSGMTAETPLDAGSPTSGPKVIGLLPGSVALDEARGRLVVAYGNAESRTALGPHYIARLGEFADNRDGLLGALRRMHDEGDQPITLRAR